jgi:UDPglucose--hexose-1-phosphate uridylyltransferase
VFTDPQLSSDSKEMNVPDFRFDPVKNSWVIVASGRGQRPSHYEGSEVEFVEPRSCPFCTGNEKMTPPEVFAARQENTGPDTPGWSVRIVPNKFPALSPGLPQADLRELLVEEIHGSSPAFGIHEILIETPVKNRQMVDMDQEELGFVLSVLRDRLASHHADSRFRTVIGFKNHGKEAGASLVHSHSQIMALPMVPGNLAAMVQSFSTHQEGMSNCLYCEIIDREKAEGKRVVESSDIFVSLAPFAAASPFQVRIVPVAHSSYFTRISDEDTGALAAILGSTLRRLRRVLGEHPWNMVFYTAPAGDENEIFHWFVEITPRVTTQAGFEMGSGISINTVAPEECAELLRRIQDPESRSQEKS